MSCCFSSPYFSLSFWFHTATFLTQRQLLLACKCFLSVSDYNQETLQFVTLNKQKARLVCDKEWLVQFKNIIDIIVHLSQSLSLFVGVDGWVNVCVCVFLSFGLECGWLWPSRCRGSSGWWGMCECGSGFWWAELQLSNLFTFHDRDTDIHIYSCKNNITILLVCVHCKKKWLSVLFFPHKFRAKLILMNYSSLALK